MLREFFTNFAPDGAAYLKKFWRKTKLYQEGYEDILFEQEDVHFCAGVRPWLKGLKQGDIAGRSFFVVDVDIRKLLSTSDYILADAELEDMIAKVIWSVSKHPSFRDWRFLVSSGNGMHLYYFTDMITNSSLYKSLVSSVYLLFDQEVLWFDSRLSCDKSTCTINHLFRLPGTYNTNRLKWWLQPELCDVIGVQEWRRTDIIERILYEDFSEKKGLFAVKNWVAFSNRVDGENDVDVYSYINANVSTAELLIEFSWLELQKDGKNFKSRRDGKNIGIFYDQSKNILVVQDWNGYIKTASKALSSRTFAKEVLGIRSSRDIFKRFSDKFGDVAEVQRRSYEKHKRELGVNLQLA